jgi:proline iminopeptidase
MSKIVFTLLLCFTAIDVSRSVAQKSSEPLARGEHYAKLSGISFWYKVVGKGPLLVVQASGEGFGSEYLRNGLALLEQRFTMVYYDTRGSAHSSRPADEKRMSTSDMVDDLEQLRRFWGLNTMTLLGHSHGGAIALGYAIRYPKLLHKLVLVDAQILDYDDSADIQRELEVRQKDPRFREAIAQVKRNEAAQTDKEFDALLKRMLPLYFYDPISGIPRLAKTNTGSVASIWVNRALVAADKPPMEQERVLDRVEAQTLILVGRVDWVCPVSVAERIHKAVRQSRLVILDNAGHFPWIENPQQFFAEVIKFVGS